MKKIIFSFFFVGFSSIAGTILRAEVSPQKTSAHDCANFHIQDVESRIETLKSYHKSLETLLTGKGDALLDINVLFQIDLTIADEIKRRAEELSVLSQQADILNLDEVVTYIACATSSEEQNVVQEFAQLQAQFNSDKISFLTLDPESRDQLMVTYDTLRNQAKNKKNLDLKLKESTEALSAAQNNLRQSEQQSTSNKNINDPLMGAKAILDKKIVELEDEQIKFISQVRSNLDGLAMHQSLLANIVIDPAVTDLKRVEKNYGEVIDIWRYAADDLFSVYRNVDINFVTEPPQQVDLKEINPESQKLFDEYQTSLDQYKARRETLMQQRLEIVDQWKAQSFRLLSEIGYYRSMVIEVCDEVSCDRPRGLAFENISDIIREVKLIPLKILSSTLTTWLEAKSKFKSGFDGWLDLLKQIFSLFLLFLIPVGFFKGLNLASNSLEKLRSTILLKSEMDHRQRTYIAIWISRLNPFIPFIGMIIAINFAIMLIDGTELRDFSKLLSYVQYYYYYRILRLIIAYGLNLLATTTSVEHIRKLKNKIQTSAKNVSRLVFTEYFILVLIEDSARRALAYGLASNLIFLVNIYYLFYECYKWKLEILDISKQIIPKTMKNLGGFINTRWIIVLLPLLIGLSILTVLFNMLKSYLARKEFTKWILSEILRKQLELTEKPDVEKPPLPPQYLKLYNFYTPATEEIFVQTEDKLDQGIVEKILEWSEGKSAEADNIVLIVGNRGIGKTTKLLNLFKTIEPRLKSKLSSVSDKIITEQGFFAWISDLLGYQLDSVADLHLFDAEQKEPIVFFVDDIHNLFLSKIGGFVSYNLLLQMIGLKTKNILWCFTITARAWSHLNGVFGKDHFYGDVFTIPGWKDVEIQKLITLRHSQSGLQRKFDDSIKAYGSGSALGEKAESQFFRLLWGQSRGNPRAALMYWVSAITFHPTGYVDVGVPLFVHSSVVSGLSNEALFTLAALSRHDNLTQSQLEQVTCIAEFVIKNCLKECLDKSLIWEDSEQRFRISSRAQYIIDYFLMGKNFLYE